MRVHSSTHLFSAQERVRTPTTICGQVGGNFQHLPPRSAPLHAVFDSRAWLQLVVAGHWRAAMPPQVTPGIHAPFLSEGMPAFAAMPAFQYVMPSQPQTGSRTWFTGVVGIATQVPVPHVGASQYLPGPQGSTLAHVHAFEAPSVVPPSGHV